MPVQANQWHSLDTQALVDVRQALETSLGKSRPVKFCYYCVRILANPVTFILSTIACPLIVHPMDYVNELVVTNHQTPAGINYKNVFKTLDESLQVHIYLVAHEYTE